MNIWKHIDWEKYSGTWMIASNVLTDDEIQEIIHNNPTKYGSVSYWNKIV